jgi:hypothetical protein
MALFARRMVVVCGTSEGRRARCLRTGRLLPDRSPRPIPDFSDHGTTLLKTIHTLHFLTCLRAKMPPKKAKARGKRAASPASEDEQPKAKQAKGGKGGKKVKAEPIADEEEDKVEVEADDSKQNGTKEAKEEPKFTEAQVAKAGTSRVPLDEECPLHGYRVYIDPDDGIIYDAALNQTNAGANNNKFYRIQVSKFGRTIVQFISADTVCEASRKRS